MNREKSWHKIAPRSRRRHRTKGKSYSLLAYPCHFSIVMTIAASMNSAKSIPCEPIRKTRPVKPPFRRNVERLLRHNGRAFSGEPIIAVFTDKWPRAPDHHSHSRGHDPLRITAAPRPSG